MTTDVNPYYDSFVRWQFEVLHKQVRAGGGAVQGDEGMVWGWGCRGSTECALNQMILVLIAAESLPLLLPPACRARSSRTSVTPSTRP